MDYSDYAFYYEIVVANAKINGQWNRETIGKFDTRAIAFVKAARIALKANTSKEWKPAVSKFADDRFKITCYTDDLDKQVIIYATRFWK